MNRTGHESTPSGHDTAVALPDAASVLACATFALLAGGAVAAGRDILSAPTLLLATLCWSGVCLKVLAGLRNHPYPRFGAANRITTVRAVITVAIGALAVEANLPDAWLGYVSIAAVAALALDGIDGALARATGLASAFGARYDMEIDALLALALSVLVWRTGELGIWILALGTMRYAFLVAARWAPALNAPLYPSLRRKTVCVLQIAALCLIVTPVVTSPLSTLLGGAAVAMLGWSFARDTRWLLRQDRRYA